MRTRLFFILFLLSGFVNQAHSQIGNEILNYVDSTEIIVNKGRQLMLQKLNANDFAKTTEIFEYLNELTAFNTFKAFGYSEKLAVNTLTSGWKAVLLLLQNYEHEIKQYVYPDAFPLLVFLEEKMTQQQTALQQKISQASLSVQEIDLLQLYLRLMTTGRFDGELNQMVKNFRETYKTSPYDTFLNATFPIHSSTGNISFALGPMMLFPYGKIASDFKTQIGVDFSMDYNRNRLYTSLFVSGAGAKPKNDFGVIIDNDSINFTSEDRFSYLNTGIKAGYMMVSKQKFRSGPYVSIGGTLLESNMYNNNKDGEEYQVFNAFAFGIGLHTEVKLIQFEQHNYYNYTHSSLGLKLDGGYSVITKHKHGYKGNMPYVSMTLVWGFGDN